MPKPIKKRPAKKKAVKDDEVKSAALQAIDKLKDRQKQVIIAASVVAAAVIVFVAIGLYSSSVRSKAYSLEREASRYYHGDIGDETMSDEERWKKALELFRESIDIKATPSALYYAGNCYYNLGDYENAVRDYSRFADTFSSNKGILPLVYQKLASSYFHTEQNEKALAAIDKLAGIEGGIFKDTALVLEARYYERTGEKEKALEKYRTVMSEFPTSPWSAEAGAKVSAEEAGTEEAARDDASGETAAAPAEPLSDTEEGKAEAAPADKPDGE